MAPDDWFDLSYLERGTVRQRAAYRAISDLGVMVTLAEYSPVLVGTVPIDIDISESDLDILCHASDHARFAERVTDRFAHRLGFVVRTRHKQGLPATICSFRFADFEFELFAQDCPVTAQNGFRHMVIEARLLELGGPEARAAIRRLKASGVKTEPAFAAFFGLPGDPYQTLLALDELDDESLRAALARS